MSRQSPDALDAAAQYVCALLITAPCKVQHHLGLKQDTRERAPEIVGHDGEQVVPRPYRPLLAQEAPRDVDFDGTAPQLVRGFEAARRPRV
jgi:hypothetical protein